MNNETNNLTPLTKKNPPSSILRAPLVLEDNTRRAVFSPFNPKGKEFNQRPETFPTPIKTIALD